MFPRPSEVDLRGCEIWFSDVAPPMFQSDSFFNPQVRQPERCQDPRGGAQGTGRDTDRTWENCELMNQFNTFFLESCVSFA